MKNKRTIIIIIILALLATLLFALKILTKNILAVVDSSPKNNQANIVLNQVVKITFNQNIKNEFQITFSPLTTFKTKIIENTLEIIPDKPLIENTQYKITILNSRLKNFSFELSFKTISQKTILEITPFKITPPPTYEETKKYYDDWSKEIHQNEPLYDFVPYKTETYFVYYTAPLTLTVITKKDTPQIRKEISDWIISKGIDPETHQINWKVKSTLTF